MTIRSQADTVVHGGGYSCHPLLVPEAALRQSFARWPHLVGVELGALRLAAKTRELLGIFGIHSALA